MEKRCHLRYYYYYYYHHHYYHCCYYYYYYYYQHYTWVVEVDGVGLIVTGW